jgi:hypothetical protein
MQLNFIPTRTDDAAAFIADRAKNKADEQEYLDRLRDELVASIAKERKEAKLKQPQPIDMVAGLHSVIVATHGAALVAAFMEGGEAFGDLLQSIVVRQMELDAEVEALKSVEVMERECRYG